MAGGVSLPPAVSSSRRGGQMPEGIANFFRELADTYPKWNFIFFYDPVQLYLVLSGLWVTIQLSVVCVILSVVIGIVGA